MDMGINYLAVFAAAVAAWLLGAIWYTALSKAWLAALGKTKAELAGPSGKPSAAPFILSFLAELVMATVLAVLMARSGTAGITGGLAMGALAWLGFVATTISVNNAYPGRRLSLTMIDSGHWLAVLLVQGAIIGWFGAA
jgi:hypothetical protein